MKNKRYWIASALVIIVLGAIVFYSWKHLPKNENDTDPGLYDPAYFVLLGEQEV